MVRGRGDVGGRGDDAFRLPSFPDRATPGGWFHDRVARAVAVLALAVTAAYLTWRAVATIDLAVWWVSLPLYLLELHAALGLGLYVFSLWDLRAQAPARPVEETGLRVAAPIRTWNEPPEVLVPTIAAAVAVRPAHETWVLDDGDRPQIARLATDLGARYLRRDDRSHAKAGNLNHALGAIEADVVAVLDADHVARPDLLTATLGYFDDPRVALVQTPQDFYNLESFEHSRTAGRDGFNEQSLFYRAILAGKNRWQAACWLAFNLALLVAAIGRIRAVRYGGERRASVRFAVSLPARLDGAPCVAEDLSLTGARLTLPTPLPGEPSSLVLEAPGRAVALRCPVRARFDRPDGSQAVGAEFAVGQWPAIGTLTHLLFNAGVGLELVEEAPERELVGAVA